MTLTQNGLSLTQDFKLNVENTATTYQEPHFSPPPFHEGGVLYYFKQ